MLSDERLQLLARSLRCPVGGGGSVPLVIQISAWYRFVDMLVPPSLKLEILFVYWGFSGAAIAGMKLVINNGYTMMVGVLVDCIITE